MIVSIEVSGSKSRAARRRRLGSKITVMKRLQLGPIGDRRHFDAGLCGGDSRSHPKADRAAIRDRAVGWGRFSAVVAALIDDSGGDRLNCRIGQCSRGPAEAAQQGNGSYESEESSTETRHSQLVCSSNLNCHLWWDSMWPGACNLRGFPIPLTIEGDRFEMGRTRRHSPMSGKCRGSRPAWPFARGAVPHGCHIVPRRGVATALAGALAASLRLSPGPSLRYTLPGRSHAQTG